MTGTQGNLDITSCVILLTQAELVAARNAGVLNQDCTYIITDFSQGTVGAAQLFTRAVAPNKLAETVQVNTAFDNAGWYGQYDLDTNLLYDLRDNNNNRVLGNTYVGTFPWGNANFAECTIIHSTFTPALGVVHLDVHLVKANVNTSGMSGAQASVTTLEVISSAVIFAGNIDVDRVSVDSACDLRVRCNTAGAHILRDIEVSNTAITITAGYAGVLSMQRLDLLSSTITIAAAYGNFTLLDSSVLVSTVVANAGAFAVTFSALASASITASGGNVIMSYVTVESTLSIGAANTSFSVTKTSIVSGSTVTVSGAASIVIEYSTIEAGAAFNSIATLGSILVRYCLLSANYIGQDTLGFTGTTNIARQAINVEVLGASLTISGAGQNVYYTQVCCGQIINLTAVTTLFAFYGPADLYANSQLLQVRDATLTALAGLVTAADQMIYSTGVDAFAMTGLSAAARTLLALTTTNAMYANISANKPVAAVYLNAASHAMGAAYTIIPFDTVVINTGGGFSTGTGRFTCPLVGRYAIDVNFLSGAANATSNAATVNIFLNGVQVLVLGFATHGLNGVHGPTFSARTIIQCAAGDIIDIRGQRTAATDYYIIGSGYSKLNIEYLG